MADTSQLMWSVLFGGIGLGFFLYGKKQKAVAPLFAGIALMAFPYVVTNTYALVGIGLALIMLPFIVRF